MEIRELEEKLLIRLSSGDVEYLCSGRRCIQGIYNINNKGKHLVALFANSQESGEPSYASCLPITGIGVYLNREDLEEGRLEMEIKLTENQTGYIPPWKRVLIEKYK